MKNGYFNALARKASLAAGTPRVFVGALAIVVAWAASGPLFGFNDTWQLVINTGTTIITFLMVFLIQHTQNADATAMQIKLDELIRVIIKADNVLLNLETMDQDELETIRRKYEKLAADAAREKSRRAAIGARDANADPEHDEGP